jgi:hypothetical protein
MTMRDDAIVYEPGEGNFFTARGSDMFFKAVAATTHFGNGGPVVARLLVLHAPPLDAYFEELQALWAGDAPPTPDQELALIRRHGMEPANLPGK